MTPNQVIVTLQTQSGQFSADYELPSALPVSKLSALLLNVLEQQYPQLFGRWKSLQIILNGTALKENDTLAARNVWDGSILSLREG